MFGEIYSWDMDPADTDLISKNSASAIRYIYL